MTKRDGESRYDRDFDDPELQRLWDHLSYDQRQELIHPLPAVVKPEEGSAATVIPCVTAQK